MVVTVLLLLLAVLPAATRAQSLVGHFAFSPVSSSDDKQTAYSVSLSGPRLSFSTQLSNSDDFVYLQSCSTGAQGCTPGFDATPAFPSYYTQAVVDGNYLVVGTSENDGNAVVYECSSVTICVERAVLVASDASMYHSFGESVDIQWPWIVVGAPGANANEGALYSFLCVNNDYFACEQVAILNAGASAATYDDLGYSVVVSVLEDGVAIIAGGAPGCLKNHGCVYTFACQVTNCTYGTQLVASVTTDDFGRSLAMYETTLVVGSYTLYIAAPVYVFSCPTAATCTETTVIEPPNNYGETFGHAVGIYGTTVVVGAPYSGFWYSGAVFVFDCPTLYGCTQRSKLVSNMTHLFGKAVSIDGGTVAVAQSRLPVVFTFACNSTGCQCAPGWVESNCDYCDKTSTAPYLQDNDCVASCPALITQLSNGYWACAPPSSCPTDYPYTLNQTWCVKQCPSEAPLLQGLVCVTTCEGTFTFNASCVDVCPDQSPFAWNGTCVDVCPDQSSFAWNGTCVDVCPDQSPFAWNGTCVDVCPDQSPFVWNGTCVDVCPDQSPFVWNGTCVDVCPDQSPFAWNGTCVDVCPDQSPFAWNGTCVDVCPDQSPFAWNGTCVDVCPDQSPFVWNGTCVASCPQDEDYHIGANNECVLNDDTVCSTGAIVGIVIGGVAGVALLAGLIACFAKKHRESKGTFP